MPRFISASTAAAVLFVTAVAGIVGCGDDATAARDSGVADTGAPVADTGTPTGPTPTIPAPSGPCPTFETGVQTILGLETHMAVGAVGGTPGPLLFVWHGTGGNGMRALDGVAASVRDDIVARGGIIIAPSDNGAVREGHSPNGVWYESSDLEYADHLVACAVMSHDIDPRRIYVTGCSAGGLMASAMAVERSRYVAAAAPDSGGTTPGQSTTFDDPMHVPAVMTLHGGVDDTVIVNFGETSARLLDAVTTAGGFGVDCNHMSGHCGASTMLKERAWELFEAHPFGTSPSPYAARLPTAFPDYCVIWE